MMSVSLGSAGSSIAAGQSARARASMTSLSKESSRTPIDDRKSPRQNLIQLGRTAIGSLSPKKSLRSLREYPLPETPPALPKSTADSSYEAQRYDGGYSYYDAPEPPGETSALGLTGNEDALRKEQEARLRLERAVRAQEAAAAAKRAERPRTGGADSRDTNSSVTHETREPVRSPSPPPSLAPAEMPDRQRMLNSATARRARRQRSRALDFLAGDGDEDDEDDTYDSLDPSLDSAPPATIPPFADDPAGVLRVTQATAPDSLLDSSSESENHPDDSHDSRESQQSPLLDADAQVDSLAAPHASTRDRSATITASSRPRTVESAVESASSQKTPLVDAAGPQSPSLSTGQTSSAATAQPNIHAAVPRLGGVHRNEISQFASSRHPLASQYVFYTFSNGLALEDFATIAASKVRPYELLELHLYNPEDRVRLPRRSDALPSSLPSPRSHAIFDQTYLRPYAQALAYVYKPNASSRSAERAGLGQWKLRWLMLYGSTLALYRKRPSRNDIAQALAATAAYTAPPPVNHTTSTGSNSSLNAAAAAAAAVHHSAGSLALPLVTWDLDTIRWVGSERADGVSNPPLPSSLAQDSLTVAFTAPAMLTAPSIVVPQGTTGLSAAGGYGSPTSSGSGSAGSGGDEVDHTISLRFSTDHQAYAWHRIFQRAHLRSVAESAAAREERLPALSYLPAKEVQRALQSANEATRVAVGVLAAKTNGASAAGHTLSRRMAEQERFVKRAAGDRPPSSSSASPHTPASTKSHPSPSLSSHSTSSSSSQPSLLAIDVDRWRQLALHRAFLAGRGGVVAPGRLGRNRGRNALARTRLRPDGADRRLDDADAWSSDEEDEDFCVVVAERRVELRAQQPEQAATPPSLAPHSSPPRASSHRPTPSPGRRPQSSSSASQQPQQHSSPTLKQQRRVSHQGSSSKTSLATKGSPKRQPSSPELPAVGGGRGGMAAAMQIPLPATAPMMKSGSAPPATAAISAAAPALAPVAQPGGTASMRATSNIGPGVMGADENAAGKPEAAARKSVEAATPPQGPRKSRGWSIGSRASKGKERGA